MFESDPADYPLFKDQGTSLFGDVDRSAITSPTGGTMRFEGTAGETVFRKHVAGQEGAHFMLFTYEEIRRVILPAEADIFARRVEMLGGE